MRVSFRTALSSLARARKTSQAPLILSISCYLLRCFTDLRLLICFLGRCPFPAEPPVVPAQSFVTSRRCRAQVSKEGADIVWENAFLK